MSDASRQQIDRLPDRQTRSAVCTALHCLGVSRSFLKQRQDMRGDAGRLREMQECAGRCGEIQGDAGGCGEMQGDAGRCGEMRGD